MNLLQRIAQHKEVRNQIKSETDIVNAYQLEICSIMNKLLKLIHTVYNNCSNLHSKMRDIFMHSHTIDMIMYINDFKEAYINYKNSVEKLTDLHKSEPKKKLKIKDPQLVIASINDSFVEIYSKFLVQGQFDPDYKIQIKEEFINTIKELKIPLHTNENKIN